MDISEQEKEKIRKEARRILDNFSKALEKVKAEKKKKKKETGGFREEKEGMKGDEDFRRRMFENAPEHNENNIIAEKKRW